MHDRVQLMSLVEECEGELMRAQNDVQMWGERLDAIPAIRSMYEMGRDEAAKRVEAIKKRMDELLDCITESGDSTD